MYLASLDIHNVRIIESARLAPDPASNVIIGPNGSGKTSLLEAIAVLGSGHSFATHRTQDLIRRAATSLVVAGRVHHDTDGEVYIGVEKGREVSRLKVNGELAPSASKVMRDIPVLAIGPHSQTLLLGGPKERRNLLDRTLFHVEQDYLQAWRRYHGAMQQRNAQLKLTGRRRDLDYWNQELARLGEHIDSLRKHCVEDLDAALQALPIADFTGRISISYRSGWQRDKALLDVLEASLAADQLSGATSAGPHRAELQVKAGDWAASSVISRGQAKIIVSALVVAQASIIARRRGIRPVVLVDDLGAELGPEARQMLLGMIAGLNGQTFVTVVEAVQLPAAWVPGATFHVKHGAFARAASEPAGI